MIFSPFVSRSRTATVAVVIALGCAGCHRGADPWIDATGTIEARQIDVAPLVPARIASVVADEGAVVRAGDTLATLSVSTLTAEIAQRQAHVAAADAALRDLQAGARAPEIARGEAELRAAEEEAQRAQRDVERLTPLARSQTVSQQQLDAAKSAAVAAASKRDAAQAALRLLAEGARPERIAAARAEVDVARAALAATRATGTDLVLVAPSAGTVLTRHAEAGEVIGAGVPVLTIADLTHLWVRVFVAAPVLPHLRIGQRVVTTLAGIETRFPGHIVEIDAAAQFTPRVALTDDERADLLFGVKVALDSASAALRPGLPATVRIDTTAAGTTPP